MGNSGICIKQEEEDVLSLKKFIFLWIAILCLYGIGMTTGYDMGNDVHADQPDYYSQEVLRTMKEAVDAEKRQAVAIEKLAVEIKNFCKCNSRN